MIKSICNSLSLFFSSKIFSLLAILLIKSYDKLSWICSTKNSNVIFFSKRLFTSWKDNKLNKYGYLLNTNDNIVKYLVRDRNKSKADLWSIGILAYVLYFGKVPQFKSKNNFQSIISIEEDYNLEDLLQKLLVPDPTKRISWEEFFEHNFFKQKIFGEVTKKDFDEVCQKYPKLQSNLGGLEIEECYDKELNSYGEVIKGTKILHGRGIYISKSLGVLVKGYFFDGKQNGKSEMIFSDGGNFEGEFLNGVKFGKGKEVYPNGNEYEGEYKNGLFDGFGIFKYNNGNYYEGEFKCDSRYGKRNI